jgi:hypothetical protein
MMMMIATIYWYTTDVTIGFNSTTYTVTESEGSVLLQIELINGEFGDSATVNVSLNTINGSANCKQNHKISVHHVKFCF